jgi:hypothetical protein
VVSFALWWRLGRAARAVRRHPPQDLNRAGSAREHCVPADRGAAALDRPGTRSRSPPGRPSRSTRLIIHGWPRADRLQTPISVGGPVCPQRRRAPPHQPPR